MLILLVFFIYICSEFNLKFCIMDTFIYFPCSKNGQILKGFCPTVADGNQMLRDVCNYKLFSKRFGIRYYAFKVYSENDLCGISLDSLSICKL